MNFIKMFLLKKRVFNFVKDIPTKTQKEIIEDKNAVMLVSRVEDFNQKEDAEFWELPVNKSFPRDLVCIECGYQCVMSNGLYDAYCKNKNNPKVVCSRCAMSYISKQKNLK